ncbi:TPA: retron Ec67 family RNA-directed DNA polymerase/endonuclease [Pseudomonas putida]|nr:retron Ec67 family RNA-directed DNA polymerase/endonuclease [Pseudomonas putida]
MSKLAKLRKASSLSDLANILEVPAKSVSYLLYIRPKAELYEEFEVPKKTGGVRKISAPCSELKYLQKQLAKLLQECSNEIHKASALEKALQLKYRELKKRNLSHGFNPGYSIVTNAIPHRNKNLVLNIDLQDFFGSIHFGRVRGYFIKNNHFKVSDKVATVIAQIATHKNALPQGSPCSPIISNLIAHVLDIKLAKLAYEEKSTYTRYADDITFSTNRKSFSEGLAKCVDPDAHVWVAGALLEGAIKSSWFSLNPKKTRLQYRDSRQVVTGLTVNSKVNVRAEYHRTAKAMTHSLFRTGNFEILKPNSSGVFEKVNGSVHQLNGILSFIYMINAYNRDLRAKHTLNPNFAAAPSKLKSIEESHRKFIFYKDFYASPVPTIICEGKTDNIYLRAAMYSLSAKFPELVETSKDGSKKLKVKLFKYTDQVKYLMGMTGGTGEMVKFMMNFTKECAYFKAPNGLKPVVMLIDNDKGANEIYNKIHQLKKLAKKPDGSDELHYIGQNLYVLPTPLNKGNQTMIEDLFEPALLKTILNGKTFNPDDKKMSASEYSKNHFAKYVVKAQQDTINFSGFEPLLNSIVKIIKNHSVVSPAP